MTPEGTILQPPASTAPAHLAIGATVPLGTDSSRRGATGILRSIVRFDLGALVFALVSATLFTVSQVAFRGGVLEGQPLGPYGWVDGAAMGPLLGLWIATGAGCYFIATALMAAWAWHLDARSGVEPYRASLARCFWPCLALIGLCWTPWIVSALPATMDQDTIWQVLIWRTPDMWYDHHPWLTTAIFGSLFDLGAELGSQSISLGVACVAQSLLFAAGLAASLSYVHRFRRARPFFWVALVWCCVLPTFPYYACRLEKDTLFCLGLIPFTILLLDLVRTRGRSLGSPSRVTFLTVLVVWLVLTKKTGIYILVPTLLFAAIYCRGGSWWPSVIAGGVGIAAFALWQGLVLSALGVGPGPRKELFSLPFQQTARVVSLYPDDVSPEEREAIAAVLPYDDLPGLYNFTTADPVKDEYFDGGSETLVPYFKAWLAMGLRHPGAYVTATLGTNLRLFDGEPFVAESGDDAEWVEENVEFFSKYLHDDLTDVELEERDEETGEGITEWPQFSGLRSWMNAYAGAFATMPLSVANCPAIMQFYLPFLCACCIFGRLFRGARGAVFVAIAPWALIVASILIGPMTLDRYFITGLWCLPLLMALPLVCRLSGPADDSVKVGGRHSSGSGGRAGRSSEWGGGAPR